jgi:dTDP-4-amino-4,6-dideoxygalactose transaminase
MPATLPKSPVFDWSNLRHWPSNSSAVATRSVEDAQYRVSTTSGRAALVQAMRQLGAEPGSMVLVPSYHCPSIVASMVLAGLQPRFYGVGADGLPDVASIALDAMPRPKAMVVVHYFGLPRSLRAIREWCDTHGIVLVEDCAHSFFGTAGDRTVGQWGDYATASTSKFFPVPEGGLLVSASHPLKPLELRPPTWRAQLKGWADVLETSYRYGRVRGARALLGTLLALKQHLRRTPGFRPSAPSGAAATQGHDVPDCDMGRVDERPLLVTRLLLRSLDRERIVSRRRANYSAFAAQLGAVPGVRGLRPTLPDHAAPYVFPLWVDDADRVYDALRGRGMPVLRWDRIWPGTPTIAGDIAPAWRTHVLQLLCHQDLEPTDICSVCGALRQLVAERRAPVAVDPAATN